MFFRIIRGMVPHKTARGAAALERLKVFEGVPTPYDRVKRVVVPDAMRVLRLKPGRKFTVMGDLSKEVGWKYKEVVEKLEEKRKVKNQVFFDAKTKAAHLKRKALVSCKEQLKEVAKTFEAFGYTL